MRLFPLALLIFALASPSWAARKTVKKHAAPSPSPTATATPKADASEEDKLPPSTPVDTEPTPEPSLPRFDATWRACREDKDCIAIDTHCGWGCINGSSEKPASMYYRQLAPFIECTATGDDKPNAICVKKECVCQH